MSDPDCYRKCGAFMGYLFWILMELKIIKTTRKDSVTQWFLFNYTI